MFFILVLYLWISPLVKGTDFYATVDLQMCNSRTSLSNKIFDCVMYSPKLVGFVLFCFAFVSSPFLLLVQYLIQSFSLFIRFALLLPWSLDLLHFTEGDPPIK